MAGFIAGSIVQTPEDLFCLAWVRPVKGIAAEKKCRRGIDPPPVSESMAPNGRLLTEWNKLDMESPFSGTEKGFATTSNIVVKKTPTSKTEYDRCIVPIPNRMMLQSGIPRLAHRLKMIR